jgi:hypothetical protein
MPKSSKDVANLFRSLAPDNAAFQPTVNASVREAEQRWPLLKTTPPKKFDLTPELSDEERQHWLSAKRTKPENRKQALTVPSSVSKDKLAESLQKMAGSKVKTKVSVNRAKPAIGKTITPAKAIPQANVSVASKKTTEVKKSVEINKIVEAKQGIEINKIVAIKKAVASKKMALSLPAIQENAVDGGKSLRGIFNRLTQKKSAVPEPMATKSSVLSKLSKR